MNKELEKRLKRIEKLEKKNKVLGVSVMANNSISMEDASITVENILTTVDDINEGRVKFYTPDFELLDSLRLYS